MFTEFDKDFRFNDFEVGCYYAIEEKVENDKNSFQSVSECVSVNEDSCIVVFKDVISIYGSFSKYWNACENEIEDLKIKKIDEEDYPEYFI